MTESTSKRLGFFSFFQMYTKSNSEKLKKYLHQCSADPILKSSTLLRDFLSPQREGDFIEGQHPIHWSNTQNTSSDLLVPTPRSIPDNLIPEPPTSFQKKLDLGKSTVNKVREPSPKSSIISSAPNSSSNLQSLISDTCSLNELYDTNEKANEHTNKTINTTTAFDAIFEHAMTNRTTTSFFPLDQFDLVKVLGKGCMGKVNY
jgi:hypothetical protein